MKFFKHLIFDEHGELMVDFNLLKRNLNINFDQHNNACKGVLAITQIKLLDVYIFLN